MYDYSILPPHIISYILSHLKISDFHSAVQTCKSWYHASCDPRITKTLCVSLSAAFNDVTSIDFVSRPITHLRLTHLDMKFMNQFKYRDLLCRFGHTIIELDLLGKLSMTRLFEMLIYLPNIVTLKFFDDSQFVSPAYFYRSRRIRKYRETIYKNLAHIKSLTIQTSLRDIQLYRLLLQGCTNLEHFSWYDFGFRCADHSIFLIDFLLNPSENRNLENVTDLLIRTINEKHNSKFFESISNLKLAKLKILNLAEISVTYYDTMFKQFCSTYRKLEKLTIYGCNDQHLNDICKYMTKLKSLTIDNCNAESSIILIKKLLCLDSLHVERSYGILDISLIELMALKLINLQTLSLNHVTLDLLKAICDNCSDLENLTLNWMDTKDCEPIFRNLINLRKLHLLFTELAVCHSSKIISSPLWNITKLTNLHNLWISCFVPGITPDLIKQLPNVDPDYISTVDDPPIGTLMAQSDINSEESNDQADGLTNDINDLDI